MSVQQNELSELFGKIARLVQERGWTQEEFAKRTGLNRLTVRRVLHSAAGKVHNSTVKSCADALGLSVSELRVMGLDDLIARMPADPASLAPDNPGAMKRGLEDATQPELVEWAEANEERARKLSSDEWDELLSLQGTGGPLSAQGVEYFVNMIERKRGLWHKMQVLAGTAEFGTLEAFVDFLMDRVQPYRGRALHAK